MSTRLTPEQQAAVLYWPEIADIPIIPADTRNKKIWLDKWQEMDFTNVDFRAKLANGEYDEGIAIRTGKTLYGKYYSIALDFDGWDAVVEWFSAWERVIALSKQTVVEWHQDFKSWPTYSMFIIYCKPFFGYVIGDLLDRTNIDKTKYFFCFQL